MVVGQFLPPQHPRHPQSFQNFPVASGIQFCFGLKACHKAGNPDTAAVARAGREVGSSRTWLLVLGSMWVVEEGTLAECSGNEWSRRDGEDTGKVQEADMWDMWDTWELWAAEDTCFCTG